MFNKKARFAILWIFVASFFFLVAIAMIEPLKVPLGDAQGGLSCSTTTNSFIKPVCFLLQGGIVLFVGGYIAALLAWVYRKSVEK